MTLPRSAVQAPEGAIEWKKYPRQIQDSIYFKLPGQVRGLVAPLMHAGADEIDITTGASRGLADACHCVGGLLLFDLSQCLAAMPLDVRAIGAGLHRFEPV